MSYCDKCGFQLPDGAIFCPNCGAAVRKKMEVPVSPGKPITNFLKIGLLGAFLSVTISSFSQIPLYFVPSFISSLIVLYLSKPRKIEDATIIAMTVYLFADAIIAGMLLSSLYINSEPLASLYGDYVPTLADIVMYVASPVTAFVAGYIGISLAPKKKEEPLPITSREGEEKGPGGIVYSLERNPEETSASSPQNV